MPNIAGAKVSVPITMLASRVPATITPYDWWFNGSLIPSNSPFWTYATDASKVAVVNASTGLEVARYIENFDYANKSFCLWGSGGAEAGRQYLIQAGPTISKVNASSVFTGAGATARYGFNEASGDITDSCGNYNGTASNIESYGNNMNLCKGVAFNGNNSNVNIGSVTQLASATKATVTYLASQDVVGAVDYLYKSTNDNWSLQTYSDNRIYIYVTNATYGYFTYNSIITAGIPFLVHVIYDGTQPDNASRLKCFLNGQQRTLSFNGTIPASLPVGAGVGHTFGAATLSLDGKLDEVRIMAGTAISADQALLRYNNWFQNDFWTVGNASLLSSRRSSGGLGDSAFSQGAYRNRSFR